MKIMNKNKSVLNANIKYHDQIADVYEIDDDSGFIFTDNYQKNLDQIISIISKMTDDNIAIDIGCGTGNILKFFQNKYKFGIGFDISRNMLKIARKRHLPVTQANIVNLPVSRRSVDLITAFSVLHHLFDHQDLFKEVFFVLKKGGIIYTDIDPNGCCFLRKKIIRYSYRRILLVMNRILGFRDLTSKRDTEQLKNLAEYHHNFTQGINPIILKSYLYSLGFSDVRIFLHFRKLHSKQINNNKYKNINPVLLNIAPLFGVIARK